MSPLTSPTFLLRKPDWVLVALARDGNDAAFGAIVVRYGPELHRYCRRLLRDQRAEDAVQQAFVQALQAIRSGTQVRELRAWLYRIARNVALTELGAARSHHSELSEEWEDSARADEVDSRECLRQALLAIGALPERQRTALMRAASGDDLASIAATLGISTAAARQLLHRARVTVRAAAQAILPPPVVWFARRMGELGDRIPTPAAVPASLAPLAGKMAVLVIGAAVAVAPAALIHGGRSGPTGLAASAGSPTGNTLLAASTTLEQPAILSLGAAGSGPNGSSPFSGAQTPLVAVVSQGGGSSTSQGGSTPVTATTDPTATDASTCTDPNDPTCGGSTDQTCTDPNDPSCGGGSTDQTCTDPNDPSCGGSTDTTSTDTTSTDTTSTDTTTTDTTSTDTTSTDTTSTDTTSTDTTSTDTTSTDTTSTGP